MDLGRNVVLFIAPHATHKMLLASYKILPALTLSMLVQMDNFIGTDLSIPLEVNQVQNSRQARYLRVSSHKTLDISWFNNAATNKRVLTGLSVHFSCQRTFNWVLSW